MQELNKNTIFSALVTKTTQKPAAVDIDLDIPDLPEDMKYYELQVPGTESYEWVDYANVKSIRSRKKNNEKGSYTDDEGFCSVKSSPVSDKLHAKEKELWDTILDFSISDYIDWDMRKE